MKTKLTPEDKRMLQEAANELTALARWVLCRRGPEKAKEDRARASDLMFKAALLRRLAR